jgi:HK97 family phage prohead protease
MSDQPTTPEKEIRYLTTEVRLLDEAQDKPKKIVGYAARYDQMSENLGGFREKIAPGAFDNADLSDVRALFNHDPNYILGRTGNNTLRLTNTVDGLAMENDPPDVQYARDLLEVIRRGDVNQMSFAFNVPEGGDKWEKIDGEWQRTLYRIGRVFDVSVVTYPAYPTTSAAVRSFLQAVENKSTQATPVEVEVMKLRQAARQRSLEIEQLKYKHLQGVTS